MFGRGVNLLDRDLDVGLLGFFGLSRRLTLSGDDLGAQFKHRVELDSADGAAPLPFLL